MVADADEEGFGLGRVEADEEEADDVAVVVVFEHEGVQSKLEGVFVSLRRREMAEVRALEVLLIARVASLEQTRTAFKVKDQGVPDVVDRLRVDSVDDAMEAVLVLTSRRVSCVDLHLRPGQLPALGKEDVPLEAPLPGEKETEARVGAEGRQGRLAARLAVAAVVTSLVELLDGRVEGDASLPLPLPDTEDGLDLSLPGRLCRLWNTAGVRGLGPFPVPLPPLDHAPGHDPRLEGAGQRCQVLGH